MIRTITVLACCQMLAGCAINSMIPPKKLPLVTNGVANTVIVVNAQGDWEKEARRIYVETHAAAALQAHLRQMSGTEVPIATVNTYADVPIVEGRLTPEENVADTYIILGDNALSRRLGVTTDGLTPGGFHLVAKENWIALVGHPDISHPREDGGGIRHAVQNLLEQLGCHYLWPGELGKVVPQRSTLVVSEQNQTVNPPIRERRIRPSSIFSGMVDPALEKLQIPPEAYRKASAAAKTTEAAELAKPLCRYVPSADMNWLVWHGLGGDSGLRGGHAFGDAWEKWGKDHPEWFALQADGTRDQSEAGSRERLCVSNPGLIKAIADEIIAEAEKKPNKKCFSICPNDGGYSSFCMCEECKALDPPNAPKEKLLVIEKVGQSKRHSIDYRSLTDRYVHFWNAIAERVTAKHPDVLLLIQAYHVYSKPPVRETVHPNLVLRYVPSNLEGWKGWRNAGARRMYWRPNILWSHAKKGALYVQAKELAQIFNTLARDELLATDMDSLVGHWATQGFTYYAAARLNWNPHLSYDQLLRDYSAHGFAAAASPVAAYLREVDAETVSLDTITDLRRHLNKAQRLAAHNPEVLQRIAFLRMGLNYTHVYLELDRINQLAGAKQDYDGDRTKKLIHLYYLTLRDLALRHPLAVNVPVIMRYTGHFANWQAIKARGFQASKELIEQIDREGLQLTGQENSIEDMLAAFRLDQAVINDKGHFIPPGKTVMEADEHGNVYELPAP